MPICQHCRRNVVAACDTPLEARYCPRVPPKQYIRREPTLFEVDAAYREGLAAREKFVDCPYSGDQWECASAWHEGWMDAHQEEPFVQARRNEG